MAHRTIRHKMFTYYVDQQDPRDPSKTIRVERLARQGEVVVLDEDAIAFGERFGAFETEGLGFTSPDTPDRGVTTDDFVPGKVTSEEVIDETEEEDDIEEMDDEELADYIREEQPTVGELIDAVGEDAELAERVIVAEKAANGDKARSTLIAHMEKLAESDNG